MVVLAAILAAIVLGQPSYRQNPLTCVQNGTQLATDSETPVYIRLGNATGYQSVFLRIPNYMGVLPACSWTVHTLGNGTAERGTYYTQVHVQSPIAGYSTLGDMFTVWGEVYLKGRTPMYFAADGIGQYRGNLQVFAYPVGADPNAFNTSAAYRVTTYGNTVLGQSALYIWLPDPYTSGNPGFA